MQIIAFVTDAPTVRAILAHRGEPTAPPRIAPARGPAVDAALIGATPSRDPIAPPEPAYAFAQRIAW
jgi:hypothetical protein